MDKQKTFQAAMTGWWSATNVGARRTLWLAKTAKYTAQHSVSAKKGRILLLGSGGLTIPGARRLPHADFAIELADRSRLIRKKFKEATGLRLTAQELASLRDGWCIYILS